MEQISASFIIISLLEMEPLSLSTDQQWLESRVEHGRCPLERVKALVVRDKRERPSFPCALLPHVSEARGRCGARDAPRAGKSERR